VTRSHSELRALRVDDPEGFQRRLVDRRRADPPSDGRLFIVAADHPARGALGVGIDSMAMADRDDLLDRLCRALARPGVDGVLGTADVLEDLAALGALEGKVAVGSMNRGGLRGAVFELDDRFTGYSVAGAMRANLDFGKLLLRIDLDDPGTVRTLEQAGRAVTDAADAGLPLMVEPFISRRARGAVLNELSPDAVIKSVAVSSGLGSSSARTWLKLPVVDEMERVMAATTLPTLLLGGDRDGHLDQALSRWEHALSLPGVRGLTVGRTLLYPLDGDVESAVDAATRLVHGTLDPVPAPPAVPTWSAS